MTDDPSSLPQPHMGGDIDFHEHDWVSPACVHRRHDVCPLSCPMCNSECLCVCHRWSLPIHGQPIGQH
jgi:hypothetical protein